MAQARERKTFSATETGEVDWKGEATKLWYTKSPRCVHRGKLPTKKGYRESNNMSKLKKKKE